MFKIMRVIGELMFICMHHIIGECSHELKSEKNRCHVVYSIGIFCENVFRKSLSFDHVPVRAKLKSVDTSELKTFCALNWICDFSICYSSHETFDIRTTTSSIRSHRLVWRGECRDVVMMTWHRVWIDTISKGRTRLKFNSTWKCF